jgi:hypothetical protein
MRALTYIVLFIIPFVYLLNSISTTAKSSPTQTQFPAPSDTQLAFNHPRPLFKENTAPHLTRTSSKERSITIHNKITNDMLVYHKAGENIPKSFSVFINGKEITQGTTLSDIKVVNNTLRITYEYVFHRAWVTRKGSKEVVFKLAQDKKVFDLTFSWTDKFHMMLAGAQPISITKIY